MNIRVYYPHAEGLHYIDVHGCNGHDPVGQAMALARSNIVWGEDPEPTGPLFGVIAGGKA